MGSNSQHAERHMPLKCRQEIFELEGEQKKSLIVGKTSRCSDHFVGFRRKVRNGRTASVSENIEERQMVSGTVGWARTTDLLFHRQAL